MFEYFENANKAGVLSKRFNRKWKPDIMNSRGDYTFDVEDNWVNYAVMVLNWLFLCKMHYWEFEDAKKSISSNIWYTWDVVRHFSIS